MAQLLYELLHNCTAQISAFKETGTGFFVAPGQILTCAHVIEAAQKRRTTVEVLWNGQAFQAQIIKYVPDLIDLALLQIGFTDHPCVLLDEAAEPHSKLYSYGYPDTNRHGEPTTFDIEGWTGDQPRKLKFKFGQVRPGMSGSPLLSQQTNGVCGIVQITRDRSSDLGGKAILVGTVLTTFPELVALQREFHQKDNRWHDACSEHNEQQVSDHTLGKVERRNRTRLIKRVHKIWIEGLLEHSLHQIARLDLRLQEQPDVLQNPWRFQVQELNQIPYSLPVGTSIIEVYDDADGDLLILGDPGTGKTILLLELLRTLLRRAEQNITHPIPVYFNLSTWAQRRLPLTVWLIEELWDKYQVPPDVGQRWVEMNQILPLLDGLDEVAKKSRFACVEAISSFYQGFLQQSTSLLVLCCRRSEYIALSEFLSLNRAVTILPLTPEQVNQYLDQAGNQLEALQKAIQADADLAKLASRPLFLTIFSLAYQNATVVDLPTKSTEEAILQAAFGAFMEKMLSRRGKVRIGTKNQFSQWLAYLAWQMYQREQTIFFVEGLQPSWLPNKHRDRFRKKERFYKKTRLLIPLFYGLFFGVITGVLVSFFDGLVVGLVAGLVEGILGGHFIRGLDGIPFKKVRNPERPQPSYSTNKHEEHMRRKPILLSPVFAGFLLGAVTGSLLLFLVGFIEGLSSGLYFALDNGMWGVLVGGLGGALLGGFDGFLGRKGRTLDRFIFGRVNVPNIIDEQAIIPVENLTWSWKFQFTGQRLITALCGALVAGLVTFLFSSDLIGTISMILSVLLVFWLIYGLSTYKLAKRVTRFPNQGIRESGKSGVIAGLFAGLLTGIVGGTVNAFTFGLVGMFVGASIGFYFMFSIALDTGLDAFIRHFLLRFLLWRSSSLPWKLILFLDEATERLLLYQISGSYIFVHRSLRDYLSSLHVTLLANHKEEKKLERE